MRPIKPGRDAISGKPPGDLHNSLLKLGLGLEEGQASASSTPKTHDGILLKAQEKLRGGGPKKPLPLNVLTFFNLTYGQ